MSADRRFRFAVLAPGAADAQAWRDQARSAEDLGYAGFLVPDHLGQEWGPLVSLAIAAAATERIALGPLMLGVDLRNPVVLYKELATLAQFAGDRLEIGLGAGWLAEDHARAGIPMAAAGTRIERLDDAATILKSLWRGGPLTHHGNHYDVVNAVGAPRPPQPSGTRWVLGGGGRKMLAVAAEHADIISLGPKLSVTKDSSFGVSASVDRFAERVSWVRADTGSRFDDVELQCLVHACSVTPDRDRYASRVLSRMFGMDPAEALASPLALVGTVDEICRDLEELREQLAISYWVIPAAQMRPFAAVVERLTGK